MNIMFWIVESFLFMLLFSTMSYLLYPEWHEQRKRDIRRKIDFIKGKMMDVDKVEILKTRMTMIDENLYIKTY